MLDLKLLQKQANVVEASLQARKSNVSMQEFNSLDMRRRSLLLEVEGLKSELNKASATVAQLKKAKEPADAVIAELGALSARIKALDIELEKVKSELAEWMLLVPNIVHNSVPIGTSEINNVEQCRFGAQPQFNFEPKEHWQLGTELGGLDFERGTKLAGARFTASFGWAARLERALCNFFLDYHTQEKGRTEVLTPLMVNRKTMTGTGQLPKFADDLFKIEGWDYYLIPTSEVTLTNLYADEILDEKDLPVLLTAQSPCFRSEAGSYGKDTRGLIRQHQFTKVEMVNITQPDYSYAALESMRESAQCLLERLELPYRTVLLCSGDMGFASAKTYDVEVWLPGQKAYREISSCSNCEDFQARRANIRYRDAQGKLHFVHTLNGSGLPTGRTLVAIIENYQQQDGSIRIPKALIPYMNGLECIEKS